ncbi:MAG: alpha/beta hydrolase [Firmicutes bacterium]|nr:alpha/beta hydrolase [Bacillota bacterium]
MRNMINGIYYEKYGNSDNEHNLVFIHGAGCNHKFLKPLAKQLKEYNCYLIDLPDHCNSQDRNCNNIEDYIEAVSQFITNLENVTLIGHSLGGAICLGVAARRIHSVKKAVILNSGAKFDKLDKDFMEKVHKNKVDRLFLLKSCGSFFNLSIYKALLTFESKETIIKDLIIGEKANVENGLKNIDIPVLIITGADEILTLVEYSEKLHDKLSSSKLIVVPKTRHMLPIAKSRYVGGLIKEFVTENETIATEV